MRLHSDTLTHDMVTAAADIAGVTFYRFEERGSRRRARAFDVILEGTTSSRRGNHGADYTAATWDEWGIFLSALFTRDPNMCAPDIYDNAEHFQWSTGARYVDLKPADQHARHRWERIGDVCTGAYALQACKCGAVRRFMLRGRKFAELANA